MTILRNQILPRDLRRYSVGQFLTLFGDAGLDPAVVAFADLSGATDLAAINNFVGNRRAELTYSNTALWTQKAAQNAGSGPTAYPIGDLTSNVMTLANSPSWGATGITYDGVDQNGSIADFLGVETVTVFARVSQASAAPTATEALFGQYDSGANERSFALFQRGAEVNDPYRLNRDLDGDGVNIEIYEDTGSNGSTSDRVMVTQWVNGGGRSFWINNSLISTSLTAGMAQTARFNSSADLTFFSLLSGGAANSFAAGLGTAFCVVTGTLTTQQRESITNDLNAL